MKASLELKPRRQLSRQTAWGCLTTNLAMPGFGSLLAGYRSGYAQVALSIGGTILTILFGAKFVVWYIKNISRIQGGDDPFGTLTGLWVAVRWPLLGIGLFAFGWLWALSTSLYILSQAKDEPPPAQPPRLNQL